MPDFETTLAGLTVRAGTHRDGPAAADLFERSEPEIPLARDAFGRVWDWLHWRNPLRPSDIIVGEEQSILQGHVAMLPVPFAGLGESKVAGWPCQLMVDEHWRQSLLYPALLQRLLKLCNAGSYEFAYAMVNRPRVLKANAALGLKPLGELPIWVRPYRLDAIAGKIAPPPWGKAAALVTIPTRLLLRIRAPGSKRGVVVEEIDRFEPDIDALFATTMAPAYRYVALRTSERLNWRFFGLPERRYQVLVARAGGRIVGYAASRTMPMKAFKALGIADIWHDPGIPAAGNALMCALHRRAIREGVDLAACVMPRHSPMAALLRRFWFFESPEKFTLCVYQTSRTQPYARSSIADWHPTWYDHDYV